MDGPPLANTAAASSQPVGAGADSRWASVTTSPRPKCTTDTSIITGSAHGPTKLSAAHASPAAVT